MIKSNYILYTVRWYNKLLKKKKKLKKREKKAFLVVKIKDYNLTK